MVMQFPQGPTVVEMVCVMRALDGAVWSYTVLPIDDRGGALLLLEGRDQIIARSGSSSTTTANSTPPTSSATSPPSAQPISDADAILLALSGQDEQTRMMAAGLAKLGHQLHEIAQVAP